MHLAFGRLATEEEAVGSFLARLGLSEFAAVFAEHDISLDTMEMLTDDDLQDLGLLSIAVKDSPLCRGDEGLTNLLQPKV